MAESTNGTTSSAAIGGPVPADASAGPPPPTRHTYLVLANLTLASFMTVLNTNMIRVAVGELLRAFDISVTRLTWVFTSYTLVYALLMPVFGRAGDIHGRKRLFLGGLSIFAVGSALCIVAWDLPSLVAFRCVQALGAAAVFPNALIMAIGLFGPERRGRVLGIWAASSSLGSMVGPTIGGLLAQFFAWQSIFFVNLPIAVVAVAAGYFQLRETKPLGVREPFDVRGALTLGAAVLCLLLYLTGIREWGWGTWRAPLLIGGCALGVAGFVHTERRSSTPMVDLAMFANPAMLLALVLGVIHMFCGQGSTFMMPLFLTEVKQFGPAIMGLILFPGALAGVIGSPISGGLADRLGSRRPVALGMFVRSVANVILALMTAASKVWAIIALRFVLAFCGSATWSPLLSFVLAENPPERGGVVVGVFNMVRMMGGVLGTTLTGLIIDSQLQIGGYSGGAPATVLGGVPGFFGGFMMLAVLSAIGGVMALSLRHTERAAAQLRAQRAAAGL